MLTFEERKAQYAKLKDVAYYFIIAIVSFVAVAFLPFIGSALTGEVSLPKGPLEWAIFIAAKVCIALINVILLYCFLQQAKVNVKEDKNYNKALDIMREIRKDSSLHARSPKKYFGRIWGSKGVMLFITSILSTIVFGEALLTFDLIAFLAYIFTVTMGIIMGYLQMRQTEEYWTSEFLAYANEELKKHQMMNNNNGGKEC